MAAFVGVDLEKPRTAKCWSRFRDNVPRIGCESYYGRSIAIPVMDNLIYNLEDIIADKKRTDFFSLLPSVRLSEHFNLDNSTEKLIRRSGDDLQRKIPSICRSELKRCVKQWGIEMKNRKVEYSAIAQKAKEARVDWKKS